MDLQDTRIEPESGIKSAAFYGDLASGREFWDNNFGQNYQISKTNGATLR